MTQRGAVFVGCRLIAVYLLVEAVITAGHMLFSISFMYADAPGGGFPMAALPVQTMLRTMGLQAMIRIGAAILLWIAAARIARAAAPAAEGEDGLLGD